MVSKSVTSHADAITQKVSRYEGGQLISPAAQKTMPRISRPQL
jgi:hypothetical protein